MALTDLIGSSFNLRPGPNRIEEAYFTVHQNAVKSDGTVTQPFTCLHIKAQPLTDDLSQPDGEPKERHYRMEFKNPGTSTFQPSDDEQTSAGSSPGTQGKFYVAMKSDQSAPESGTEFGTFMSSLLIAGADKDKLNKEGIGAIVGMVFDADLQVRPNRNDPANPYKSDIVKKIHSMGGDGAAAEPAKATAAKPAAAKPAAAAKPTTAAKPAAAAAAAATPAPTPAAAASDFDGDTWLIEAGTEIAGKLSGQTKMSSLVAAQLRLQSSKSPEAKAWLAAQQAADKAGQFWKDALVANGIAVIDGESVSFA